MASVFKLLFPGFEHPATVENGGGRPVPSPVIEDAEEYDREIERAFDEAEQRLAGSDGAASS